MRSRFSFRALNISFAFALIVTILASQSAWTVSARTEHRDDDEDQPIFTFSTVGDSRQDPVSPDPTTVPLSGQDSIWLQNTRAWSRIIGSIEQQKSNLLFFNGDMIMGYGNANVPQNNTTVAGIVNSDLVNFYKQYAFWRGMVAGLMENGTYVVPVPGNHETQCKACGKKALAVNEDAWRANMSDLILDDTRFLRLFGDQPSNESVGDNRVPADGLITDQSKLSYSFDFKESHFVVINTDPVGKDAHAPTNWLAADLATAQSHGARHFFVFGHKPAYTYYYGRNTQLPLTPSGLDNDVASRDAFWNVIEQYGAIYFCGHEHIFNLMKPRAQLGGRAWQILVGSGGSPFEAKPSDVTINPNTDRDYAWATVKVYRNGKVKLTAYGFDDQFGPTRIIDSVTIQ
jgi:hypothetical protein